MKGAGLVHPGRARGDSRRLMDGLSLAGVVRRLPATIVGGRAASRPRVAGCPAGGLFWYFQQIVQDSFSCYFLRPTDISAARCCQTGEAHRLQHGETQG